MSLQQAGDSAVQKYTIPTSNVQLQHTVNRTMCQKLMTEAAAAAAVAGPEARDGYIRARLHHRDGMPVFLTKKHMLSTFD